MEGLDIPPIPELIEMISEPGAGTYARKASVDMFKLTRRLHRVATCRFTAVLQLQRSKHAGSDLLARWQRVLGAWAVPAQGFESFVVFVRVDLALCESRVELLACRGLALWRATGATRGDRPND